MIRFYVIFTVIFLLMLLAVLLQARRQVGLSRRTFALTFLGGVCLSLLLASTRGLPQIWPLAVSRSVWWLVYGAFGLVSYLFLFEALLYAAELAARLLLPGRAGLFRSPRALVLALVLTGAVAVFGVMELDNYRTERCTVVSPKLQRPVRVVAISDLHLGAMTRESSLDALVALIKAQKPDVLLLVGDIVNDHSEAMEPFAAKLKAVAPPLGIFGIFGNHERYEGDQASAQVFAWAGARLLRNEALALPGTGVQLLGVDDPGRAEEPIQRVAEEIRALGPVLDPSLLRVLMNHRPHAWREAARPLGIEVMLSGHTHGGQMFPFHLLVGLGNGKLRGIEIRKGFVHGVSAGAGFWGPPLRVLAQPDILVLDLLPSAAAPGRGSGRAWAWTPESTRDRENP